MTPFSFSPKTLMQMGFKTTIFCCIVFIFASCTNTSPKEETPPTDSTTQKTSTTTLAAQYSDVHYLYFDNVNAPRKFCSLLKSGNTDVNKVIFKYATDNNGILTLAMYTDDGSGRGYGNGAVDEQMKTLFIAGPPIAIAGTHPQDALANISLGDLEINSDNASDMTDLKQICQAKFIVLVPERIVALPHASPLHRILYRVHTSNLPPPPAPDKFAPEWVANLAPTQVLLKPTPPYNRK